MTGSGAPHYRPGLIAEITRLHAQYYAEHWQFGLAFEAKVARELSAFLEGFRPDLDFMENIWGEDDRLVGTISLEAPLDGQALAHLRWFIVDPAIATKGQGRTLLEKAIDHARQAAFSGIYLTTFAGLDAARHLYESVGFELVQESSEDQWSGGVKEQRFELKGLDA